MAKQKQSVLLRQPLSAARFTQIMEQPATDFHPLPRTHGFGSFRALSLQRSRQLTGRCPGGGGDRVKCSRVAKFHALTRAFLRRPLQHEENDS